VVHFTVVLHFTVVHCRQILPSGIAAHNNKHHERQGMSIVSPETGRVPSVAGPKNAARTWPEAMRGAIRRSDDLLRLLGLEAAVCDHDPAFPIFVPWEYASRIVPEEVHDPLLRQVLPSPQERATHAGFVADPVGDRTARAAGGLLQKYQGRALWVLTGVCPVHCRYCFRQHYDYAQQALAGTRFADRELAWLRAHTSLEEVIFSGGDPLVLDDAKLTRLVQELNSIAHLRRLRIHTRMPVMIPQRITGDLISALADSRLTVYFVMHINHAQEVDAAVEHALGQLIDAGFPVLNQAVLLAGVNDHADALVDLSQRLIDLRVLPYYLHQLDRVQGAAHFEVPIERGIALVAELRRRLPGYAVPRFVREEAGAASKTPLA
jgi:EF-P beta-lysylation protein EpmB